MSLYLHSKCKLCRKAGEKLFLRGERCFGSKCAIIKRNYPPGVHGPAGVKRLTDYGAQLKEKQKAKRLYGLREKQFKNYYLKAKKIKGNTEQTFAQLLEQRLDNVVFKLGFAKSRNQARQIVNHRHILLNNKINNNPSASVRPGDTIAIKPVSQNTPYFQVIAATLAKHEAPAWLKLEPSQLSGQVISLPAIDDIKQNFNTKTIIEFYSK